jgi:hypothetical protein
VGKSRKPSHLRLIEGNSGHRPIPENEPVPVGRPVKPKSLRGVAARLWDEMIEPAFWLTWADGPKARMWCILQAEFDKKPALMVNARISQLRALGSELGFDPAARARLGTMPGDGKKPGDEEDPAQKYF